jgi:hypothetical protein
MLSTAWISACGADPSTGERLTGETGAVGGTMASSGGSAASGRGGSGGTLAEAGGSTAGAGATSLTGGTGGGSAGMGPAAAGQGGTGGPATGGSAGAGTGNAPASGGSSGNASGGMGSGGTGGTGFGGGAAGGAPVAALDCGEDGWAVENHGPPSNRVNYLILADGYSAETVDTTLVTHINAALERRFETESGQPYGRYRNFVNICVAKAVSESDGIGNGPTAFDGGNGGDRLARVNETKVNQYIKASIPATFEIDWKAVVLNQSKWENTGAVLMLWSGANQDGPGAALHEGGHGFHQLADEYCAKATGSGCGSDTSGSGTQGTEYSEVNTTGDPTTTGGKWDLWLGTTQKGLSVPDLGATGVQGTFQGSRYVDSGQYRPSSNSMMNSLFGEKVDTSFNSVSREQIIFTIWRAVRPIDSTEPAAGTTAAPTTVSNPGTLVVNVVDPAVINVDWTVDGTTSANAGTTFDTSVLAAGMHSVVAKAYDNASTDLVKLRTSVCPSGIKDKYYCAATAWKNSEQEVAWTVTKP